MPLTIDSQFSRMKDHEKLQDLAMFKQNSSASWVPRIWRVATPRSSVDAPAFGLDLQSASCNRTGKIEGANICHEAADTLFTGQCESFGNARCAS